MKNFYPKKGRIHPSPSSATPTPRSESLAVLQILPVAILALTSALKNDDKEVLAYLVMRSLGGGPDDTAEQRRCAKSGELHTRVFGCGCFECYTRFWSRWDCSPDRELIHRAIEAFEDHLTTSERAGPRKRRERRAGDAAEKGRRRGKEKERVAEEVSAEGSLEEEAVCEEAEREVFEVAASEGGVDVVAGGGGGGGERRKGWPDVTAIFNSRLWSLWSPGD